MLGLQNEHTTNTSEISDHLTKEVVSLGYYYRQHALYFPTPVREKFEQVFIRGLPKAMLALHGIGEMEKFEVLFRERRGKEVDLVGAFFDGIEGTAANSHSTQPGTGAGVAGDSRCFRR